jgi:hypothetical protein
MQSPSPICPVTSTSGGQGRMFLKGLRCLSGKIVIIESSALIPMKARFSRIKHPGLDTKLLESGPHPFWQPLSRQHSIFSARHCKQSRASETSYLLECGSVQNGRFLEPQGAISTGGIISLSQSHSSTTTYSSLTSILV